MLELRIGSYIAFGVLQMNIRQILRLWVSEDAKKKLPEQPVTRETFEVGAIRKDKVKWHGPLR